MTLAQTAAALPREAQTDLASLTPAKRAAILRILVENGDNKGRSRREVTTPPTRGSRKHPWG